MKLIICIAMLCLIHIIGKAQDKIQGIGPFKIGASDSLSMEKIAGEMGTPIVVFNSILQIRRMIKEQIVELKPYPDPKKQYLTPMGTTNCANTRVYFINKYTVSGIQLKNIYLTLLDNRLINIHFDGSHEITNALELKYGQPKISAVNLNSGCGPDAKSYFSKWENQNITAVSALVVAYTAECQKETHHIVDVGIDDALKEIAQCDENINQRDKHAKENEQRKRLSDF